MIRFHSVDIILGRLSLSELLPGSARFNMDMEYTHVHRDDPVDVGVVIGRDNDMLRRDSAELIAFDPVAFAVSAVISAVEPWVFPYVVLVPSAVSATAT